jgi:DNA helicase-2/ATP-dependent DNA helicase PcrA
MPQSAKLIGGAGTGKTTELLDIMAKTLEQIRDPFDIGFVSYTVAAVLEAAKRAGDRFDVKAEDLNQRDGWFRTIHSVARKMLRVGDELLTDDKASEKWITEAVQSEVGEGTDARRALDLWHRSRNDMAPYADIHTEAHRCDDRTPGAAFCKTIVDRYEQYKRLDGRADFTDLLSRVAGWEPDWDGGEPCEPEGDVPPIPAWFLDEQQDNTALLNRVVRRLVESPDCIWCYLVGDPFQSIYGFSGGNPRYLMDWQADKTRIMPRSWRCPEPVLQCGERILRECSDYWDRGIKSAPHDGITDETWDLRGFIGDLDPTEDWLLVARSNAHAKRIGKMLDEASKPWTPTHKRISSRWQNSKKLEAINGFFALESGAPIDGKQWCEMLTYIKPAADFLKRGTKTLFANMDDPQGRYPWIEIFRLEKLGALDSLRPYIESRQWRRWLPTATSHITAIREYGDDVTREPVVKVGTIHSVKGAEADNVGLLTTLPAPAVRGMATQAGHDEEKRVWYVGATRAKRRLVVIREESRDRARVEI